MLGNNGHSCTTIQIDMLPVMVKVHSEARVRDKDHACLTHKWVSAVL